jgi:hypothetical protein
MLHGNGSVLHKSPARFFAGSTTSVEPQLRAGWGKPGMARGRFMQDRATVALTKYAIPEGAYAGVAWLIPQKAGAIASHNDAAMAIAGAALAVGGITTTGTSSLSFAPAATAWPLDDSVQIRTASASITFTVADAAGQLISSGEGAAAFAFSTNTPLLTASLAAIGSTSFALSATGEIGAEASAEGAASMAFAMAATILPTNDASPARTAAASFAITGNLVPYAIGQMTGSTVDASVLTVDAIAAGVLAAALTAPIAANIRKVNDVTVTGTGTVGSEWGPA